MRSSTTAMPIVVGRHRGGGLMARCAPVHACGSATKVDEALTFVVPVLLLPLDVAMTVSVGWGLMLLGVLSYLLACAQQIPAWKVIMEHVVIGISGIAITHYVGGWIDSALG